MSVDPSDLLRPITTAAKKAAAPVLESARDHENYQHLVVRHLAPIVSNLEKPLREMRFAGPKISAASADELYATATELSRLFKTMAPPALWKRAVFWKLTDVRPVFEQFTTDLMGAATAAQSTVREHQIWKPSGIQSNFVGEILEEKMDEFRALEKQTNRIQKLDQEFDDRIQAARSSREEADKFLQAWQQGKGFVKKPKNH